MRFDSRSPEGAGCKSQEQSEGAKHRSAAPVVVAEGSLSPERAKYATRLFRPFRACSSFVVVVQGRCPWLFHCAPSGLKRVAHIFVLHSGVSDKNVVEMKPRRRDPSRAVAASASKFRPQS